MRHSLIFNMPLPRCKLGQKKKAEKEDAFPQALHGQQACCSGVAPCRSSHGHVWERGHHPEWRRDKREKGKHFKRKERELCF